ncbi:MAG: hypothetical protein ABGW99_03050 [Zunongwangia sp.]|uniref:hypothetical protein n=1 Tax=Zunongwangia sp. TaxID=1965325 RepID=UPI003242D1B9
MEKYINTQEFMEYLKENNLVIIPESYADERIKELNAEKLKKRLLRRRGMITFREISDSKLWGEISPKAAKSYALREIENKGLVKENEVIKTKKGKLSIWKIHRIAVERIAKNRGTI